MLLGRTSDIRQGPTAGFLQSEIARENRRKAEVIWHELSSKESTFNTELINDIQLGCTLHILRSRCLSEPFSELPELTEQMDLSKKADGWLRHTSHTVKHAEQHLSRRLRIRVWTSLSQVLSLLTLVARNISAEAPKQHKLLQVLIAGFGEGKPLTWPATNQPL